MRGYMRHCLLKAGADPYVKNIHGKTPDWPRVWQLSWDWIEFVLFLLQHGSRGVRSRAIWSVMAFQMAVMGIFLVTIAPVFVDEYYAGSGIPTVGAIFATIALAQRSPQPPLQRLRLKGKELTVASRTMIAISRTLIAATWIIWWITLRSFYA